MLTFTTTVTLKSPFFFCLWEEERLKRLNPGLAFCEAAGLTSTPVFVLSEPVSTTTSRMTLKVWTVFQVHGQQEKERGILCYSSLMLGARMQPKLMYSVCPMLNP